MPLNKNQPLLTVGMAVYDDYPGVYMTIQALKLYQDIAHCELIVVDNNPNTADGKATANLVKHMYSPFMSSQYIPNADIVGTTVPRQMVFDHAEGQYVMVMDSHVMLLEGALHALKDYLYKYPNTKDIISGPLLNDRLYTIGTHFNYIWRAEMWGRWGQAYACKECGHAFSCNDELTDGMVHYLDLMGQVEISPLQAPYVDYCTQCGHIFPKGLPWAAHESALVSQGYKPLTSQAEAFEIPAMGLGLFCCAKEYWAPWDGDYRGFGGEECSIHDVHRKEIGGRAICLPGLAWTHRFAHKQPTYPLNSWNKVRNYILWFKRLGYDLAPIYKHFVDESHIIEKHAVDFIAGNPKKRIWPLAGKHLYDADSPEGQAILAALQRQQVAQPVVAPPPEESTSNTYKAQLAQAQREQIVAQQQQSDCGGCGQAPAYHVQPDYNQPWTIDTLFDWCATVPRDLDKHMDVIRKYANLCDSVTDLGHRRESVLALLASSAQYVNIYSTEAEDPIIKKARELTAHRAITIFPKEAVQQAHLVQTDIGATDLLFLDTVMTFDRVLRTLEAYAPLVAKYIVIHDTQVYIAKGEDGGPGIMAAIRIWLRSNHQWFPVYITDAEYGLTVYSRVPEDRPKLPNLARKVFNFAIHAAGHVQAGAPATPDNIMEQRLDICANCMMRNVEACSACGCPLPKKTAWADQYCDHGKWGPYQSMISTGIPLV